jgi:hypothetical protein
VEGKNFAGKDSMNVFVGEAMNSICVIVTINETAISCIAPRMDSTYAPGSSL